jgi:hypothetical protein
VKEMNSKKTQRMIALIIVGVLIAAMVIPAIVAVM